MKSSRTINVRELVHLLRSGRRDTEIKARYGLSSKGLRNLLIRLVDEGLVTHSAMCERSAMYRLAVDEGGTVVGTRVLLTVPVFIQEMGSMRLGLVREICGMRLRVVGIPCDVGSVNRFQILVDVLTYSDPVSFLAKCESIDNAGSRSKSPVSHFEITDIEENDSKVLKRFVEFMVFTSSAEEEWR